MGRVGHEFIPHFVSYLQSYFHNHHPFILKSSILEEVWWWWWWWSTLGNPFGHSSDMSLGIVVTLVPLSLGLLLFFFLLLS